MRKTKSHAPPRRRVRAAAKRAAGPAPEAEFWPDLMTCGLRAGLALVAAAAQGPRPDGEADPADLYGDFA